jgi:hypothetical protein
MEHIYAIVIGPSRTHSQDAVLCASASASSHPRSDNIFLYFQLHMRFVLSASVLA